MIVDGEGVARFVSERLGFPITPPYTTMGLEKDGALVAGVIFHCWEGKSVHVTIAGEGWTRSFIREVGRYVFGQLGCSRMTVTTPYPKVVDYAIRLGGKVEGVLRDQYGEGLDATLVGIIAKEWRY